MNFYVGVTDNEWFDFLRQRNPDEVNFWRPGRQPFGVLTEGEPFLFKLHSPQNYIVGGGFFFRYTRLPLSMTWKVFGDKNGADTYEEFSAKIFSHLGTARRQLPDPEIGCIILVVPFFLDRADWIPAPRDWSPNIVSGKTYDSEGLIGKEIWLRVEAILQRQKVGTVPAKPALVAEPVPRYGSKHLVETRLGQGAFRTLVIDAYGRRCAISGEKTVPVLEAAHIKPYSESGPHRLDNGLLLRSDLHILFDEGYIAVSDTLNVEVSRKIKEEYENGRDYYRYHGKPLALILPDLSERPAPEYLAWHRENLYRG